MQGRVDEAAEAMEGRVIAGDPAARWRGAALDSRRVEGGELFFALPGERVDGHRFVAAAASAGAAAAVVHRDVEAAGATLVRVDDSYRALHRLTRWARRRAPRQLVGITGSVGKTTTKRLLAAMLARRYRVASSPGNLNNLYGFPLALLGIPEDSEWMVAEMGMSTPGELGRLSRLARPEVAVYTNVRPAHLVNFSSVEAIARAKAELLEGLVEGGLVVANRDDPRVAAIAEAHPGPVAWYAIDRDADYRARRLSTTPGRPGSRFELAVGGRSVTVELALIGRYNVENFLAAAACAHRLGIALEEVAAAAATVAPEAMRGVVHRLASGALLVDDSYNSSPSALAGALAGARQLAAGARSWCVLGDMLELGTSAAELHRAAGAEAARLGFSPVVGVGEQARELVAAAAAAGAETRWCADAAAAAELAPGLLAAEDLLLVKGSRGVGLEAVVAAVLAAEEAD